MNNSGEGLLEYTVVASIIAILAILALTFMGGRLEKLFEQFERSGQKVSLTKISHIFLA